MVDRHRLAEMRRGRREWLATVAALLDEAAVLVDDLHGRGIASRHLVADIAAARNMVNALSAANVL